MNLKNANIRFDVSGLDAQQPQVCYLSGNTVYSESLEQGAWIARHWSANGDKNIATGFEALPAFELKVSSFPLNMFEEDVTDDWQWVTCHKSECKDRPGIETVVELTGKRTGLTVRIHTILDGTAVLMRWLEFINKGKDAIGISEVSTWSGSLFAGAGPYRLGKTVTNVCGYEGWFDWASCPPGTHVYENRKGFKWDAPYFILGNEGTGQYFSGQLAWPLNYQMQFDVADGLSFKIGPTAVNEFVVIEPGESIDLPATHLGTVKDDFDHMVQAMHEHIRTSVLPKTQAPKYTVQYLMPEDQPSSLYAGDAFNADAAIKCIDVAAEVGCEVFIIDGPTWAKGYGNWVPKEEKFPQGLEPIRQYARSKGLLLGIYTEVEGGRGNWLATKQFQEHPAWFSLRTDVRDWDNSNTPNIIDMARPDAAAYVEAEAKAIVNDLRIDLYRHDMNAPGGCEGTEKILTNGLVENNGLRHHQAFYAMVDRLRQNHSELILQQASAGGVRLELYTASKFDEYFTSDYAFGEFIPRRAAGVSVHLPPEILVTPHGMQCDALGDFDKRSPDLKTLCRCNYALGQTPMIFNAILPGDVKDLTPEIKEVFKHCTNIYKEFIRPLLATCKVWHHAPVNATGGVESGDWLVMEFTAPDGLRGWALVMNIHYDQRRTYVLKLKGLDPDKSYNVTMDNSSSSRILDTAQLIDEGLSLELGDDPASELILFEAV